MLINALLLRGRTRPPSSTHLLNHPSIQHPSISFTYLPFLHSSIHPPLHHPSPFLPLSFLLFVRLLNFQSVHSFTFFLSLFLFLLAPFSSFYFLHFLIHPSSIHSSCIKHPFIVYHPSTHSSFPPSLQFLLCFHLSFNQLFIPPPGMSGPVSAAMDKVTTT